MLPQLGTGNGINFREERLGNQNARGTQYFKNKLKPPADASGTSVVAAGIRRYRFGRSQSTGKQIMAEETQVAVGPAKENASTRHAWDRH
jgi:hypothetical protein